MSSHETENFQFHRTQTPESPRPIYPPEPSNIPVLKNQNDPTFTDSSTYDIRPSSQLHAVEGSSANAASHSMIDRGQNLTGHLESGIGAPLDNAQENSIHILQQSQPYGRPQDSGQVDAQYSYQPLLTNMQASAFPQPNLQFSDTLGTLLHSQHNVPSAQSNDVVSTNSPNAVHTAARPDSQQHLPLNPENPADQSRPPYEMAPAQSKGSEGDGVNYQSLLDTLAQSTSVAPSETHPTQVPPAGRDDATRGRQFLFSAALPPRPPLQEMSNANYAETDSSQRYSHLRPASGAGQPYNGQSSTHGFRTTGLSPMPLHTAPPGAFPGSNSLPPPPMASFQQYNGGMASLPVSTGGTQLSSEQGNFYDQDDSDHKWGPDVQNKYDRFLSDERSYVTEGVWDRFPPGSRMFVGNLPTEKVTKRDLFHIFHKHGKLAQISIKQAYGFVQFLDASDCYRALQAEQGVSIRGRKLHLEISKPQKSNRNAGPAENSRVAGRKRSRSPERRGGRRAPEHANDSKPSFGNYRDDGPRRRNDYRPGRSPSPRSHRGREDHGSQHYRDRSRSHVRSGGLHRSPSPRARSYDDEADLPIPRRHPNDVPDIEIIVLDEVDRSFIVYLENSLRSRGLQCQTVTLGPQFTLAAIVKRQIIEGVQAIVKLTRSCQYSGKIPLQVFDRTAGADVRFNEYVDLDIPVATEIVLQNRRSHQSSSATPYNTDRLYGISPPPPPNFAGPPAVQSPQGNLVQDTSLANLITNLDGSALQKLLGAMQPPPGAPTGAPPGSASTANLIGPGSNRTPDLASLLTSVARQQQPPPPGHGQNLPLMYPPSQGHDNISASQGSQNVHDIMHQLSQFRRQ